jgi:hypothetical protein
MLANWDQSAFLYGILISYELTVVDTEIYNKGETNALWVKEFTSCVCLF